MSYVLVSELPLIEQHTLRARYPEGKYCRTCGKNVPIEEWLVWKKRGVMRVQSDCPDCIRTASRVRMRATRAKDKQGGVVVKAVDQRLPIPKLSVGHRYEITDPGKKPPWWDNDETRAESVIYSGPCVARWGINWGIATATGIRCFTPGTLVGLDVREVGKSA